MAVTYITPRSTATASNSQPGDDTGQYRNPLPMTDGTLLVSYSASTAEDLNIGSLALPISKYAFRMRTLKRSGSFYVPDQTLTGGITKTISYWDPDVLISYNNVTMWELQPVEVVARSASGAAIDAASCPGAIDFHKYRCRPRIARELS